MKLREFVKQSLLDIVDGVREARQEYPGIGVDVVARASDEKTARTRQMDPVYMFEFDVSVTAGRDSEISASGGAEIFVAQIDAQGKQTDRSEQSNRIKFSIPVCFSDTFGRVPKP